MSPSARKRGIVVCQVTIFGPAKVAQLRIEDARRHADVKRITGLLQIRIEALLAGSYETRQAASALFLPGARAVDVCRCIETSPFSAEFVSEATALSTFWSDARDKIVDPAGEVFFELEEDSTYRLTPLRAP